MLYIDILLQKWTIPGYTLTSIHLQLPPLQVQNCDSSSNSRKETNKTDFTHREDWQRYHRCHRMQWRQIYCTQPFQDSYQLHSAKGSQPKYVILYPRNHVRLVLSCANSYNNYIHMYFCTQCLPALTLFLSPRLHATHLWIFITRVPFSQFRYSYKGCCHKVHTKLHL